MAATPDILQLVAILDEAGFGQVAGELLTEVNLGKEMVVSPRERQSDDDEQTEASRQPFQDDEQYPFAMAFLQERLVIPAFKLAEAERIAGAIMKSKAVPIVFISAEADAPLRAIDRRAPGDDAVARKLEALLKSLSDRLLPPDVSVT